jgi:hypothetical protein
MSVQTWSWSRDRAMICSRYVQNVDKSNQQSLITVISLKTTTLTPTLAFSFCSRWRGKSPLPKRASTLPFLGSVPVHRERWAQVSPCNHTICFTICLCTYPDFDGYRGLSPEMRDPNRGVDEKACNGKVLSSRGAEKGFVVRRNAARQGDGTRTT